jgi:glycosyltransferase involved in cell wall biosynthesis
MHIAMIGQKGLPAAGGGGIERHVAELGSRLIRYGHMVTVYSRSWYSKQAGVSIKNGVQSIHLPSVKTKHLDTASHTLFATIHALAKTRPDIIHYHGVGPALFAWIPRVFSPRTTVIATFHCVDRTHAKWGRFARLILRIGEWAICAFPHATIVVSETLKTYAKTSYGCDASCIPNGATLFSATTAPHDALERFGLTPGAYILSVTRLIPHKGTRELIEAFRALSADARYGKKLVIAGDGHYTASYVRTLKAAAEDDPDIIFTGFLGEHALHALYANAYAFVHASRSEGMPIAVLDAMAAGLPVLLSDIPEHRELGVGDESLFDLSEDHTLLLSLARLLQEWPEKLTERGRRNRRRAETVYAWERITERTAALYRAAAERGASRALPRIVNP